MPIRRNVADAAAAARITRSLAGRFVLSSVLALLAPSTACPLSLRAPRTASPAGAIAAGAGAGAGVGAVGVGSSGIGVGVGVGSGVGSSGGVIAVIVNFPGTYLTLKLPCSSSPVAFTAYSPATSPASLPTSNLTFSSASA